jgi:2-oxoglutarate dehydrogenase E1 component
MAGRLNVLANVVRKPMRQIFTEFTGEAPDHDDAFGSGDVKYHLGTSYDRPTVSGKLIHLSLLANPSHLEVLCACLVPSPPPSPFALHPVRPLLLAVQSQG